MTSVYISRNLNTSNRFQKILEAEGFSVEGWSMVTFGKIDSVKLFPQTDWIFFYSKNAVKYFFEYEDNLSNKEILYACMGKGTEAFLASYDKSASFTGTGNTENIVKDFKKLSKGKKVLFPRALHSLKSIQRGIEDSCTVYDLPIYTNVPVENPEPSVADYLVFTSPMNVDIYLQNHKIKKNQKLIAIGKSTARGLMHQSKRKVFISPRPEEKSLAEFVLLVREMG